MRQQFVRQLYSSITTLNGKQLNNGYSYLSNQVKPHFSKCGLYFFCDHSLKTSSGADRIVRIGKTGDNKNCRLSKHRNNTSGNSAFRRHVGRALTQLNKQQATEQQISSYIHILPFLYVPIASQHDLKLLEECCIEILSNNGQRIQIDVPGAGWLGWQRGGAVNPSVPESHLWNHHHTGNYQPRNIHRYSDALNLLDHYIKQLP